VLKPLGVQFESSASEAGAAALLGASIHYPVRGAVTWKSIVGTNVAADALSNLASAGLTGGALIIVGEDYGEGASVIQERTHAIALKSSLPLIDPRYDMPKLVEFTERAFDLSEASHLPVILSLRIRAAHMTGSFVCKDNRPSRFHPAYSPLAARYDYLRIPLPPSIYLQEKAKIAERLPAARRFITQHHLNERLAAGSDAHPRIGIVTPGGLHATVARALRRLGLADAFGRSDLEMLVLNVVCPLVPEEIAVFMADMDHVLVVEEGFPPFIEQEIRAIAHSGRLPCNVSGKDALSTPGEFTPEVLRDGISRWLRGVAGAAAAEAVGARQAAIENAAREAREAIVDLAPPRLPGFCTGCPERPIFTALKLLQEETGPLHISLDIGCNTFASLPPFNLGSTVLGYGLSLASGGAAGPATGKSAIAVMGDGGFWHNGFITGAVNAQWNRLDAVLVILERLRRGHRTAVNPVEQSTLAAAAIEALDRIELARDRGGLDSADRFLRRPADARYPARRSQFARAWSARGDLRPGMHARASAPRAARACPHSLRGRARVARALRRRRGSLRRRSRLHAAQRMPLAHDPALARSAQIRSGRVC
jgi:indolepyruvate ferredoxin oxidoreductase alpha subunit